ncbi:hypothetical protein MPNT_50010 [Candidatus Methylacidithermus pantelleriae]|uniref:Uncharacterized protein n=1 Tax=Candidatus Methylacidithermus pantelleriae TaxID=2744239 RepID=A0A8J2BVF1_9BACT|nr:hypothetical protein MPNT_50010 [Candidatus Methylacidithermus pantelleriae]
MVKSASFAAAVEMIEVDWVYTSLIGAVNYARHHATRSS